MILPIGEIAAFASSAGIGVGMGSVAMEDSFTTELEGPVSKGYYE